MEHIVEIMLEQHTKHPVLNLAIYTVDVFGSVLTAAWIAGLTDVFHFYILIITSISLTFTLFLKIKQWSDKRKDAKEKES